jgi:hypothetical protein
MSFFKKVWDFLTMKPENSTAQVFVGADVPIIVYGGEPICTIVVEGAGVVELKNQEEETKSS